MKAFVGRVKDLPEYRDYWSEEPVLHDAFIASVMSWRRYEKLVQYFPCSLPDDEVAGDKLTKVRKLITVCTENFYRCFAPCQYLSFLSLAVGGDRNQSICYPVGAFPSGISS